MDENINAQGEELETTKVEAETTEKKEETVANITAEVENQEKMVPESALLKWKKEAKQAKKMVEDLKEIQRRADNDDSVSETEEIKSLAEENNIDPSFLKKLSSAIRKEIESGVETKISDRLKPIQEKEKAERLNKIFEEHYNKALDTMPEYKDVVNKDVMRSLVSDPRNKNKTIPQIMEESFGHLISGKKTMDASKPATQKDAPPLDFNRAKTDTEYFKQIMSDPQLKAKYNETLTSRLGL